MIITASCVGAALLLLLCHPFLTICRCLAASFGGETARTLTMEDAELLSWSICARMVALTFFISLCSIHTQVLALCSKKFGVTPVADVMERMKKDYPSFLQRFSYFPTVFWIIGNSDSTILMVNKVGILCSAVAILGLESSLMWSMALLVAILSLLSLDIALDLSYHGLPAFQQMLVIFYPRPHQLVTDICCATAMATIVSVSLASFQSCVWLW